jgi:hypothetical protein
MKFREALILTLALSAATLVASHAQAGLTVGTFNYVRNGLANFENGVLSTQARASLLANFPGSSITATDTLTPEFLSGIDVLFLVSAQYDGVGITPLSAAEKTAVYNFVLGGGGAIMLAEDYADHPSAQSLVDPFGVTIDDDGVGGLQACTIPSHPTFDGPFGVQPFFAVYGSGAFTNLGPYATSLSEEQTTGLPVMASIESGVLGPGSGRVLMFGDVSAFADPIVDGGYFSQGETLFLNSIAFVAAPEPGSIALAGLGLLALGLVGRRRTASRKLPASQPEG